MDLNLTGKVAVVTGGGGSICGEIVKALVGEGVHTLHHPVHKNIPPILQA